MKNLILFIYAILVSGGFKTSNNSVPSFKGSGNTCTSLPESENTSWSLNGSGNTSGSLNGSGNGNVTAGQMPALAKDKNGVLHLVFGRGDSIFYSASTNGGASFIEPQLVAVVPKMFSFATRGPQIVVTQYGCSIIACSQQGDIYSFQQQGSGLWKAGSRVNDLDTTAKEGLIALGSDGHSNLFAAWLDLRNNNRNNIYGARSGDGGITWSKNQMIYTSADGHTCECCKPSVVINGKEIYVMFRNWLDGNRDLYVIHSSDSGKSFSKAKKLGNESWKLDGCPMDGGAFAVDDSGILQTVWNRKGIIYASSPGGPETALGQGRSCTIETIRNRNLYAWVDKGEIILLKTQGDKISLGKGQLPILKAIDKSHVLCIWENEKQIQRAIVVL